jgi:predicted amino acid-binding ACT domain protein
MVSKSRALALYQPPGELVVQDERDDDMAYYERSSPTLLTMESSTPPKPLAVPRDWWPELNSHVESRLSSMRNWRLSWWEHWALLAEYILPRRYHWLITANTMARGLPINTNIIDPTGCQAMRICAAGLMSGLTSPSRPWFKMKPALSNFEPDRESQLWLDEVENRMYRIMAGSNLYESLAQMYEDIVVFGTAPVIIYEDAMDTIRSYNPCAGEYMLATSAAFRVESLYRQFVLTIAQMVEMFGLDKCPVDVQEMWRMKGPGLETERVCAHALEPNFGIARRDGNGDVSPLQGDFTYREVYWVYGNLAEQPLSIRGFKDCPFISPRWATTSNDAYGRSVAMDVLPDIMQLQIMVKRKAEAVEKIVRPPLKAAVSLKNEPSSILPGHITYVQDAKDGISPIYTVNPDLAHISADIQDVRQRIKSGFFNDLFLMLEQAEKNNMTAYEVAQRQQEKMQVLGPVIERMQNEALSPLIQRVFSIMQRKKMFPPLPAKMRGIPLQIEYISMLAQAQKAAATAGIERVLGMAGNIVGVSPEVMDNIDIDETLREYGDMLNVPHKIFKDKAAVAAIRAQRAQQNAAQQQLAMASHAAQVLPQAAQTLSQTQTGAGQSALDMMLGQGGGGQ